MTMLYHLSTSYGTISHLIATCVAEYTDTVKWFCAPQRDMVQSKSVRRTRQGVGGLHRVRADDERVSQRLRHFSRESPFGDISLKVS